MARAKSALSKWRGSAGSMTYSVYNGKQVIKEKVTEVANPQSNAQMRTRVAFGTVAKAGAALADLVGISFQGISKIPAAKRRFNALNISKLASQLRSNEADGQFAPKGMSVLVPNKYVVSDGSLRNANLGTIDLNGTSDGFTQTSVEVSIKIGELAAADFISQIYGCLPGDQITVVGIRVGIPAEKDADSKQILRDGEMVSVRASFKDASALADIEPFDVTADITAADIAAYAWQLFDVDKSYDPLVRLLTIARGFAVDETGDAVDVTWDVASASAEAYYSLAGIFGSDSEDYEDSNGKFVAALGYFRSHLGNAGMWMFSRCVLKIVDPVYSSTTYGGEYNINYGYKFGVALPSYLKTTTRENTRYTETGGSINQLGF